MTVNYTDPVNGPIALKSRVEADEHVIARDIAKLPGTVEADIGESRGFLATLAGAVAVDILKVALQTGNAVIGRLAANIGVNIGTVDVASMPPLPAGTNTIGTVGLATLPAGTNNIGDVDVLTLPPLPAGTNTIGKLAGPNAGVNIGQVDLATTPTANLATIASDTTFLRSYNPVLPPLPAGTNNIGDVDVLTMPPLPAGTNAIGKLAGPNTGVNIGQVDLATTPTANLATIASDTTFLRTYNPVLPPLPAGTNNIGDVDVMTLPPLVASTAAIGKLAPNAGVVIGSVDLAATPTANLATIAADTTFLRSYNPVLQPLPAGTNNIGDVDVLTLPPLPAGLNAIGKLATNNGVNIGTVDVSSVSGTVSANVTGTVSLAPGTWNIGDVDVLTLPPLPAGTNTIGKLAANVGVNIGTVDVNGTISIGALELVGATALTPVVIVAAISSVTLAAANANRVGCIIFNNSTARLYVRMEAGATTTNWCFIIEAGGYWEMPRRYHVGIITGVWASATGDAHVTETV
jgi:hypothetical protein